MAHCNKGYIINLGPTATQMNYRTGTGRLEYIYIPGNKFVVTIIPINFIYPYKQHSICLTKIPRHPVIPPGERCFDRYVFGVQKTHKPQFRWPGKMFPGNGTDSNWLFQDSFFRKNPPESSNERLGGFFELQQGNPSVSPYYWANFRKKCQKT